VSNVDYWMNFKVKTKSTEDLDILEKQEWSLIFCKKIFEFGAKTSALISVFPRRQTSCVVVKLNRLVNRRRNFNFDFFVSFIRPQSLALDGDHLLLSRSVVVGMRRTFSKRFRSFAAEHWRSTQRRGNRSVASSPRFRRAETRASGWAAQIWSSGSDRNRWRSLFCQSSLGIGPPLLVLVLKTFPELFRRFNLVVFALTIQRASGRSWKSLLFEGGFGRRRRRDPGGQHLVLRRDLSQRGQPCHFKGRNGRSRRCLRARFDVNDRRDLSTERQSLVGRDRRATGFGQAGNDVTIAAEVGLTPNQDDGSIGRNGSDLRTPEVEGGKERGRVRDLVAEHEHVGLAEGEVASAAAGRCSRAWNEKKRIILIFILWQ